MIASCYAYGWRESDEEEVKLLFFKRQAGIVVIL
jgi:hypothetical protein